jgi:hypothetical protein
VGGLPDHNQSFVTGIALTSIGSVPQVQSVLTWRDRLGSWKARWGIGRMRFTVDPGLYALGAPDEHSPVFVTANYKMSFDRLRSALVGRNGWILVLDTNGINVWCAAGKGTFGTAELTTRIQTSGLSKLVTHRRVILPQLGAPGVALHRVHGECGFKAVFGPVLAEDVPAFLDSGMRTEPHMRLKAFPLRERLVLIPVELVGAIKLALLPILVLALTGGLGGSRPFRVSLMQDGVFAAVSLLSAVFTGSVLTPLLLPWVPFRSFSGKGLIMGILNALVIAVAWGRDLGSLSGRIEMLALSLLVVTIVTYLSMNFTGASTFTSLSGVRKEMRWSVPVQVALGVLGLSLWTLSRMLA